MPHQLRAASSLPLSCVLQPNTVHTLQYANLSTSLMLTGGEHDMSGIETDGGINPGHYSELLDRTHIASSYLQMALGEHPVLARHPELMAFYETAVDQLERLYQAVGQHDITWK